MTQPVTNISIEKDDIQGLLIRGYSNLPSAAYCLLHFKDAEGARSYLKGILNTITPAEKAPDDKATHVAFTYKGLDRIGLHPDTLSSFSRQFKEGMTAKHRRFILGDEQANSPDDWSWGGPNNPHVHMLLLLYAKNTDVLDDMLKKNRILFTSHNITEIQNLDSRILPNHKEHFGFRDGLSQPFVGGFSSKLPKTETVFPPGEFVLGYHNLYKQYPDSPEVNKVQDTTDILPDSPNSVNKKDFGKNGSYLVFRQMSQNVPAFWDYMKTSSNEPKSGNTKDEAIKLASKMVGRWPSGCPLVASPERDDPEIATNNDFNYWEQDLEGLKCPVGAHIRRTNPRDRLLTEKTALESKEMVLKHRLLRRGRPYGNPMAESMEPEDLMDTTNDKKERGLHFICFVGDLIRQFEFVQNAWVKFHKFGGLYADSDPIIGTHHKENGIVTDTFTMPAEPFRKRYRDLPQFTQVRGGGYFFFPGIKVIKYLTTL